MSDKPKPGDLIEVVASDWYALPDGGKLMVVEPGSWTYPNEIYVVPRSGCSVFFGPNYGPPRPGTNSVMSTSGGPFRAVKIDNAFERIGDVENKFWCWQDRPRAGGGMDYTMKVTLWKLERLVEER